MLTDVKQHVPASMVFLMVCLMFSSSCRSTSQPLLLHGLLLHAAVSIVLLATSTL